MQFCWNVTIEIVVVQLLSCVLLFLTPWTAAHQATLSFTISHSLLKFMSIESMIPSNHLVLCHPFVLLPSIFPSIRVFPNELVLCIRWPKYWASASASVLPMIIKGWFPFQLTPFPFQLVSLQSKELSRVFSNTTFWRHQFLWCSAFFTVQLSHPYMTSGKKKHSFDYMDWCW